MRTPSLRELLHRTDSWPEIHAAGRSGRLERILGVPFLDHVGDVYARLERAAASASDPWWVKLAVLVHEAEDAVLCLSLDRTGFADVSPQIRSLLRGFGRLWKIHEPSDLEEFVASHRNVLAPLLLFELAHEGAATPMMHAVAEVAGIASDFEGWAKRLKSEAPLELADA